MVFLVILQNIGARVANAHVASYALRDAFALLRMLAGEWLIGSIFFLSFLVFPMYVCVCEAAVPFGLYSGCEAQCVFCSFGNICVFGAFCAQIAHSGASTQRKRVLQKPQTLRILSNRGVYLVSGTFLAAFGVSSLTLLTNVANPICKPRYSFQLLHF